MDTTVQPIQTQTRNLKLIKKQRYLKLSQKFPEEKQQLLEEKDADNIRKVLCKLFIQWFENLICVDRSTESTVLVRSGYSFVAVEVKVYKYNRLGSQFVLFSLDRVLMFPLTLSWENKTNCSPKISH